MFTEVTSAPYSPVSTVQERQPQCHPVFVRLPAPCYHMLTHMSRTRTPIGHNCLGPSKSFKIIVEHSFGLWWVLVKQVFGNTPTMSVNSAEWINRSQLHRHVSHCMRRHRTAPGTSNGVLVPHITKIIEGLLNHREEDMLKVKHLSRG